MARVNKRGQVIIPKKLRDKVGMHPGDDVDFVVLEDGVWIVKRGENSTLGNLLTSDIVGMWKDRDDIGDSVEFAAKLRKRAE